MDIQKRIDRYIRKYQAGGTIRNGLYFAKLCKIAEEQGRDIIISIDSPGGFIGSMGRWK